MTKRTPIGSRADNYENVLMCLICRSLFDDRDHQPKFLPCHHTFCKECLREYVQQLGDEIECPSCRKVATIPAAGISALQTNFYIKYIQSLVHGSGNNDGICCPNCAVHSSQKVKFFCRDCSKSVCDECVSNSGDCVNHATISTTSLTEEGHQQIDARFAETNAFVEKTKTAVEGRMKRIAQDKDCSLQQIDAVFSQHVHTLNRRATLLKNKVIDIYNEELTQLESFIEEVSTAMTCLISLKDFYEGLLSAKQPSDVLAGIAEMREVEENLRKRIILRDTHIEFEEQHGSEKLKFAVKDLGRVRVVKCDKKSEDRDITPVGTPTNITDETPKGSFESEPSPPLSDKEVSKTGNELDKISHNDVAEHRSIEKNLTLTDDRLMVHSHNLLNDNTGTSMVEKNACGATSVHLDENNWYALGARPKTLNILPGYNNTCKNDAVNNDSVRTNISKAKNVAKPVKGTRKLSPARVNAEVVKFSVHRSDDKINHSIMEQCKALEKPYCENSDALHENLDGANGVQMDKMYHLVYTSYDEEELLKELKVGVTRTEFRLPPEGAQKNDT